MIELNEHVLPLMVQISIYSKGIFKSVLRNIFPVTFTNLKMKATAQIITSVNEVIIQHKSLSIEIYVLIKRVQQATNHAAVFKNLRSQRRDHRAFWS